MSTKLFKNLVVMASLLLIIAPVFVFVAQAQPDLGLNYANDLGLANPADPDPRAMAVNIVKYLMTFLGIIAVVVILIGGFRWMTAGGNETRMQSAYKLTVQVVNRQCHLAGVWYCKANGRFRVEGIGIVLL